MPIEFGTDGWRAVISDEFTFANVRHVAQAIADHDPFYQERGLVIGYDTRFLSDRYAGEMARVLAANGIPVYLSAADAATPVVSYAVLDLKAAGGIMITASHNPPRYNGIKLKTESGGAATKEQSRRLEDVLHANMGAGKEPRLVDYDQSIKDGRIIRFDPLPAYARHVANLVNLDIIRAMDIGIVVDSMYGSGRGAINYILGPRGRYRLREIRGEMNPGFGGIHPEPIARHLGALLLELRQTSWEVGLATDGDADRIGAMTHDGQFVDPHRIFALALRYLVERKGWTGDVVKTVSTTQMVDALAARYGLTCHETPVGFNYICDLMGKLDVLIGGEESGGISIKGHIPEGDGILMGLLLLEIMADSGQSLSHNLADLYREVGHFHYERRDLALRQRVNKAEFIARLKAEAPAAVGGVSLSAVDDLDGVKYRFADGSWLLMRPSGTEPVLRVYAEALSPEHVQALLAVGEAACGPR